MFALCTQQLSGVGGVAGITIQFKLVGWGDGGGDITTHNSYVREGAVDGGNACPAETGFIGYVI